MPPVRHKWIFDTGGAGPGAWEGGVGFALSRAALPAGTYPDVVMGSSVGAYMAANAASRNPEVYLKGWSDWGAERITPPRVTREELGLPGVRFFRAQLKHSINYVLDDATIEQILSPENGTRLIVCATQLGKRNGGPIRPADMRRVFLQSITRKWPIKWINPNYTYRLILFDSRANTTTPGVVKLTSENLRQAIMASCLIPLAMGMPLRYQGMDLIDGGFSLKLALQLPSDKIYAGLERQLGAEKTVVVTSHPEGVLWETSMRLHRWNDRWDVQQAMREGTLLIISPPRKIEAGTLCRNNRLIMKTFWQGVERAEQVMRSDVGRRFFET